MTRNRVFAARRNRWQRVTAFVLLTVAAAPLSAQEIYRWVDGTGQVHFGTNPPADAVLDEVMPPPPPPIDDAAAAEQQQKFVDSHAARLKARDERLEASAKAEQEAEQRAEACRHARARISTLELNRRIVDQEGNTLDDTARLQRLEDARKRAAESCG